MLELSLSLVAGFAAYTAYVIVGDEIKNNRAIRKNTGLAQPLIIDSSIKKSPKPRTAAASSRQKTTSKNTPPSKTKTITDSDPIAIGAEGILAYLNKNGPATLSKLAKELKSDNATVLLATEKLVNDKKAVAIKRGGHPALALNS